MYIQIGKFTVSTNKPEEVRRTTIENPGVPINSTNLSAVFGGSESHSGIQVDQDSALTFTAVYGCVRIRSENISTIPLNIYRVDGNKKSIDTAHPLYKLLHDEPCEMYTSTTWRQLMQSAVDLWGNGYSKIIRNPRTYAVEWLDFIHPSLVEPYQVIRKDGTKTLRYKINNSEDVAAVDMLHISGIGFDGIKGKSPIEVSAENIGLGLAAERFGAEFFTNGASFTGVLSTDQVLKQEQINTVVKSWRETHTGNGKRNGTALLPFGFKFTPIGIPPEQAQYIATRKFQLEEVARIYGVPLHMLANLDRSTNNNIEHQGIEFVTNTMRPVCVNWEQEINRKLLTEAEKGKVYAKFNLEGLLRGDSVSRAQFYQVMVQNKIYSPNECRELEDRNPYEGGDIMTTNEPAPVNTDAAEDDNTTNDEEGNKTL